MRVDPRAHDHLGAALDAALVRFAEETCVLESDRDRESARFTYRAFRDEARTTAAWLAAGAFPAGGRAAVLMTNQARWHLAAYAVFHRGGVLVPLDFKLTGAEHAALLAHCRARVLFAEFHLWRALAAAPAAAALPLERVVVTGAPDGAELPAAGSATVVRWEDARGEPSGSDGDDSSNGGDAPGAADPFPPASRRRDDVACIVYSSGTGGRAKGCLLTHANYLEQLGSLTSIHPFGPGVRYLSILPTNHAIDFMVGFLGPYLCGAMVVHLRTLRPELVRDAFRKYRITHVALVPMVLRNLETGLRARFAELPPLRRALLAAGRAGHELLGRGRPQPNVARRVLAPVHAAFGGRLEAIFVGGAATDPGTLRFFHALGIPVANGYGLTEAGTALTLDRLDPPRPETVGRPLPDVELRILDPGPDGVGEIAARAPTVMAGYLDDPELTAETIVDGWLHTGDLGRIDETGCLRLFGRLKNMIVTGSGKNVYPEDVEAAFEGLPAKELCVFAAHYLWPEAAREERLVVVAHVEEGAAGDAAALPAAVAERNRRLPDYKRVGGVVLWDRDFPRTASLKVKRQDLARDVADARRLDRDVLPLP